MAEPVGAERDLCVNEIIENLQEVLPKVPARPCRAIALLSGGLDSWLAVKMMVDPHPKGNWQVQDFSFSVEKKFDR